MEIGNSLGVSYEVDLLFWESRYMSVAHILTRMDLREGSIDLMVLEK